MLPFTDGILLLQGCGATTPQELRVGFGHQIPELIIQCRNNQAVAPK